MVRGVAISAAETTSPCPRCSGLDGYPAHMPPSGRAGYLLAVSIVVLGLCPYVIVTTAFQPLVDLVAGDLGASTTSVQLAGGLGNAGYAVGAVLAAQLGQRFTQRRLFLLYAPVM